MPHITLGRLPFENLKRKPFRTAALLVIVTMLSATFFGGAMLALNLNAGLDSMQKRLGADLMVVPQNTGAKAEALLTSSTSSTFYFTNDIDSLVSKADGIAQSTVQTYISSLTADCCDEQVQIIGFNPATDFVIEPWITSEYDQTLETGQVIAGANINVSTSGTIKLYDHEFPVAAQLATTGTSLDNSVFVNQETIPRIVGYSAQVGHPAIPEEYADTAVSAVLIKVADGYSAEQVADNITEASGLDGLGYVYPGGITATTKTNLSAIVGYVALFLAAFWVMGVVVLLAVFSSSTNERKREFASLRIMGATRGTLVGLIVKESALLGLIGGLIGIALASLVIFPFSTLIGRQLQLPYLQVGVPTTLGLMAAGLVFAVVTGMIASVASAYRLSKPETYLMLREGE
ncbi:ABC transporter permease [Bifidobacterium eulemuris]|uniref:ABC transporter permease n=1 Tax=Bifidobacterium eulemuris TaxID=1765219 RepID=A0A261GD06_9BIFI|nr:ABC transporter permease [Bifidobacterium eulemuris]OZG69300.1 ABC transporter permease [Bifidobacterium eulemuris]QOL31199.1 ABC transporter permease [Bifidobacterium eulemuris]